MHSKNGWHFLERCGCYWKTWSLWVWAHFAPTHISRRSKVFSLSRYPSVIAQRCIEDNWIVFVSSIYNISQSNIFVHWCAYRELCDCIFVIFYSIFQPMADDIQNKANVCHTNDSHDTAKAHTTSYNNETPSDTMYLTLVCIFYNFHKSFSTLPNERRSKPTYIF